jgi:hypothetical protein
LYELGVTVQSPPDVKGELVSQVGEAAPGETLVAAAIDTLVDKWPLNIRTQAVTVAKTYLYTADS